MTDKPTYSPLDFKRALPKDANPLFADTTTKPDLRAHAERMAKDHELSAFTDESTLANWIHYAMEEVWTLSQRAEEKRIEKICREKGWIK